MGFKSFKACLCINLRNPLLAVHNYDAGRNLNLKANSHNSQFKECRKIANVSECNRVVEEMNRISHSFS